MEYRKMNKTKFEIVAKDKKKLNKIERIKVIIDGDNKLNQL